MSLVPSNSLQLEIWGDPMWISVPWNAHTHPRISKDHTTSTWSKDSSVVIKRETLYISSAVLAAASNVFSVLFRSSSNGVSVKLHVSEEAAFKRLLQFLHYNILLAQEIPDILDVLVIADKFDASQCMIHCCQLLLVQEKTVEVALLYLGIPSSVLFAEVVQPLASAAKEFLVGSFLDITSDLTILTLPLVGIEAIFSSSNLEIDSENQVFHWILRWSRANYHEVEERRQILSHLIKFVRFSFMTCNELKSVLQCNDFEPDVKLKVVLEAFSFKGDPRFRQKVLYANDLALSDIRFLKRSYKYHPIRILDYTGLRKCMAYLDIERRDLVRLVPGGRIDTEVFDLGCQGFFVSLIRNYDVRGADWCIGLYLGMVEKGKKRCKLEYEFTCMINFSQKYSRHLSGRCALRSGMAVGCRNYFGLRWDDFVNENDLFFVRGAVRFRVEVAIRQ